MENPKRKRGISLIHNQRPQLNQSQAIIPDNTGGPLTHFNYSRYPSSQALRQTSAPRPAVNFCYQVDSAPSIVPTPQEMRETIAQSSRIRRVARPLRQENRSQVMYRHQRAQSCNEMPQRYQNFEHCKAAIGQRLFGQPNIASAQSHIVERRNRFQQQCLFPTDYQPVQLPENKPQVISPFSEIVKMPLEMSEKFNITLTQPDTNSKAYKVTKPEPKCLAIQNIENIMIEPHKLQSFKPRKSKKESINLNQMEKRLLDIIKICDSSL